MGERLHRRGLGLVLSGLLAAAMTVGTLGVLEEPADAAPARQIEYRQWATKKQFGQGRFAGVVFRNGHLRIGEPVGTRRYADPHGKPTKRYQLGRWVSRWTPADFGLTELIASWNARTPRDTWVEVQVRGRTGAGQRSSWDTLGRWADGDAAFHRTSVGPQADDLARVAVDVWRADAGVSFTSYQLRVTLHRRAGTNATPRVDAVGAMASRLPSVSTVPTSRPGVARGLELAVPRYSQMIHAGDYPQYGNGGEAWCSPTSVSMVLGYLKRLPSRSEFAWVKRPHRNRFVDHAARMTYDYAYRGTGNWPFNTAYAGTHADRAFVTRLRSLREAELFIRKGIPVVATVKFGAGELDRSPLRRGTNGHLLVIVGFTESGNVIVNDPAAARNRGVRRVYDRGQFENAWLPTAGKSGGVSYVIRTADQGLPIPRKATNW